MKRRAKWQDEVFQRQRNVAPMDAIRSATSVEGYLIRGGCHFTPVQRATAIILGIVVVVAGLSTLPAGQLTRPSDTSAV